MTEMATQRKPLTDTETETIEFFVPGHPKPLPRPRRVKLANGTLMTHVPKDREWAAVLNYALEENRPGEPWDIG